MGGSTQITGQHPQVCYFVILFQSPIVTKLRLKCSEVIFSITMKLVDRWLRGSHSFDSQPSLQVSKYSASKTRN